LFCVELYNNTASNAVVKVTVVYVILAEGVQYATPAVVEEFVAVGPVALVTVTPPAVYPVPLTSPVAVYAVVEALMVADAKYNAALTVSVVGAVKLVRETRVTAPSCWPPTNRSPINEVHIDCVFAIIVP
jgi:hypothetical protein